MSPRPGHLQKHDLILQTSQSQHEGMFLTAATPEQCADSNHALLSVAPKMGPRAESRMPRTSAYLRLKVTCVRVDPSQQTHSEAHWLETTMPMLSTEPRTPMPRINESVPLAGDFSSRNQTARVTGPPK